MHGSFGFFLATQDCHQRPVGPCHLHEAYEPQEYAASPKVPL